SYGQTEEYLLTPSTVTTNEEFLYIPYYQVSNDTNKNNQKLKIHIANKLLFTFSPILFCQELSYFGSFSVSLHSINMI
uniref:hypothetical protein n=1 Tax=Phocaeicola vulgatus TaxID=821 RepID=UPI004028E025